MTSYDRRSFNPHLSIIMSVNLSVCALPPTNFYVAYNNGREPVNAPTLANQATMEVRTDQAQKIAVIQQDGHHIKVDKVGPDGQQTTLADLDIGGVQDALKVVGGTHSNDLKIDSHSSLLDLWGHGTSTSLDLGDGYSVKIDKTIDEHQLLSMLGNNPPTYKTSVELQGPNDEHISYGAGGGSDWSHFDVPKYGC
ncbi:hypothetical protein [Ralstonia mojiangensis]|uniref:hypothetical protein n=1 Tax=Ralstonia mojiangensis TaxID=2953895 RepID=UPI0021B3E3E1|nr:hypothetical protein [Ralstonia mojiangensis]MCT7328921.1 hypothetical protein [Ralstonia mojiangensis]